MSKEVKCRNYRDGDVWFYAHVKRDGMWVTLIKGDDGNVTAWSRMPRNLTESLRWHPQFQSFARYARNGTTLYCEAFVSGGNREDVKAAMRDRYHMLQIQCFAVDRFGGTYVPDALSLEAIADLSNQCGVDLVHFKRRDSLIWIGQDSEELIISYLRDNTPSDAEGWVLKTSNQVGWLKLKPEITFDLFIESYTNGRGKNHGLVGSLVLVDATGRQVAKAGGMDDETRRHMTENFDQYRGRLCEVKAQGIGSAGGLMHPRFIRMRDDKSEADTIGET